MNKNDNFKTYLPCILCGKVTENGNTFHHLYTRKAHPKLKDEPNNMIPVDKPCHVIFHSNPLSYISENWDSVNEWLCEHGWNFDTTIKKWINEELLRKERNE